MGRLGIDYYLLSDHRNVSYAYLWVRPPIEFYAPLLPLNFDGIDASYRMRFAGGDLVLKAFAGQTERIVKLQRFEDNDPLNLNPLWGARVAFEGGPWRLRRLTENLIPDCAGFSFVFKARQ